MSNENEQTKAKQPAFPFGLTCAGLNKREWFAGQALIGLTQGMGEARDAHTSYKIKNIVTLAYKLADEMSKAS